MKTLGRIFSISILIAALVVSCKKEQSTANSFDEVNATNESASSVFEKSLNEVEQGTTIPARADGSVPCMIRPNLPACATITGDTSSYPLDFTITYSEGCVDNRGRSISGSMHVTVSASMLTEGAVRTVTLNNLTINNVQLNGTRVTTNTGMNSDGHMVFSRSINVTAVRNGLSFQRTFNGTDEWISGFDTPENGDNVFRQTGSGTCVRPNGVTVTRTITTPLLIDHICGYITTGVIQMSTPQGTASIDFGNGTCDNIAVVTRPNGTTRTIELN